MCALCGCGQAGSTSHQHPSDHSHADDGEHEHVFHDGSVIRHQHALSPPAPPLARRMIEVERDLLAGNDQQAALNRRRFAEAKTLVLNLMSSPGSGKTTLLEKTLLGLWGRWPMAVIEGDQQTSIDAERIRKTGAPAVQVNTGKACHLDAQMVSRALDELTLPTHGVLFIENVGNLVCPAGFDLGEHKRVVIASVTEGEDKPLKYPEMFARADLIVMSKIDLLPYLDFDFERFVGYARRMRPGVEVLAVSARSSEGLPLWLRWLDSQRASVG